MRDIIKRRAVNTDASRALRRDRLRRLRHSIVVLEPPPNLAERHREVCDQIGALDRLESESRDTPEERAVRAHAIRQTLGRVLGDSDKDTSEPYVVQLRHDAEEYLREAANMRRAFQELVELSWESLSRLKPPGYWRESHERYVATVDDYLTALRDFTAVLDSGSDDAIQNAAGRMSGRQRDIDKGTAQYLRQLGDRYVGRY
jgi:hypothetical protein